MAKAADPIPTEAKYCTATQAIKSRRWPFGRDYFYKHLRPRLNPIQLHEKGRPLYAVAEIEALFANPQ